MTFRVAELEAKLEEKDRQLNAYKAMLFGSRSEKARIILDEQGCLDLGDLSAIAPTPLAACGFHINGTAVSLIRGHRFQ